MYSCCSLRWKRIFCSSAMLLSIISCSSLAFSPSLSTVRERWSREYASSRVEHTTTTPSFGDRMKELVIKQQQQTTTLTPTKVKRKKHIPATVLQVDTLQEYQQAIAREKRRFTIVRFYAPWCRACHAMEPLFYRASREFADQVQFVQIPLTEQNSYAITKGLDIPTVPYAYWYHPELGLLDESGLKKSDWGRVKREWINDHVRGYCELSSQSDSGVYASPYTE